MSFGEGPAKPSGQYAVKAVVGGAGALGCLASPVVLVVVTLVVVVFGGLGVLLAPIIFLKELFDPDKVQSVVTSVQGDGTGTLNTDSVPSDLVDPIKKAGGLCGVITPIVIAAQLQQASGFDANKMSDNGAQGIAQLPPDVFQQFAKDDDGDGKITPLNKTDSILALGRFDCSLAEKVQDLAGGGHTALDLTLAAFVAGTDAVRQASGIPSNNDAQAYLAEVKALFPRFDGTLPAVSTTTTPTQTN